MSPQIFSAMWGVWLTAAPAVLGYRAYAEDLDHTFGPLIAAISCIAAFEVTRAMRRLNTLCGIWLILAPWLIIYPELPAINSMAVGVAVFSLSFIAPPLKHRHGGGWSALFGE